MPGLRGYNLNESPFEAAKFMVYFEKHNLLEISRHLMLEMGIKRPADVRKFICENIKRIASQVNTNHTFLLAPSIFDFKAFSKYMLNHHNIPTVSYTKKRKGCDSENIFKKLKKFIKDNKLEQKNIIFVNFPSNRVECLHFRREKINPRYVFEIIPMPQVPFKTKQMLQAEGYPYFHNVQQIKNFYGYVYRAINFGIPNDVLSCSDKDLELYKPTYEEIGLDIVKMLRNTDANPDETSIGKFLPRIVILGRKGSGRRTQAKALADLFDLVFVDVEKLIAESIKEESPLGRVLQSTSSSHDYSDLAISSVLHKRLLQPDCLRSGWVVVGYPNDVDGFKRMQKFLVPPNKIVFLHCRERLCLRRLNHFWDKNPNYKASIVTTDDCTGETSYQRVPKEFLEKAAQKELAMFNVAKRPLLDYLSTKKEVIHIDGNHSRKTVATRISGRIEKQQHAFATSGSNSKYSRCEEDYESSD